MDISYKSAALSIDTPQKSGFLTVPAVNTDVAELDSALLCGFKHLQRQLRFALKLSLILWNGGFLATQLIVTLIFW
jgi:hypothetical protein